VSLLLLTLIATSAFPGEDTSPRGIQRVREGDFEAAVVALEDVVRDLAPQSERRRELAQAYLYLGIAHLALGQTSAAKARLRDAIAHDPSLRLTPDVFSPKCIAAFEEARRETVEGRERARSKGGGRSSRVGLFARLGGAAAAGVALATLGGEKAGGPVRFTAASFVPSQLECPDGGHSTPSLAVLLAATNDSGTSLSVSDALLSLGATTPPSEIGLLTQTRASVSPVFLGARESTTSRVESFRVA